MPLLTGRPVPKGRPRLGVHGRKAYVNTPPKTKGYEKLVGWVARYAGCKHKVKRKEEERVEIEISEAG